MGRAVSTKEFSMQASLQLPSTSSGLRRIFSPLSCYAGILLPFPFLESAVCPGKDPPIAAVDLGRVQHKSDSPDR